MDHAVGIAHSVPRPSSPCGGRLKTRPGRAHLTSVSSSLHLRPHSQGPRQLQACAWCSPTIPAVHALEQGTAPGCTGKPWSALEDPVLAALWVPVFSDFLLGPPQLAPGLVSYFTNTILKAKGAFPQGPFLTKQPKELISLGHKPGMTIIRVSSSADRAVWHSSSHISQRVAYL